MGIKWTPLAINHLHEFIKISKAEKENKQKYLENLINFTNCIIDNNEIGKALFTYNNITFRQLLYKQHRIIYYINDNQIYIVSVIHTSQNLEKAIKIVEKFIKK